MHSLSTYHILPIDLSEIGENVFGYVHVNFTLHPNQAKTEAYMLQIKLMYILFSFIILLFQSVYS